MASRWRAFPSRTKCAALLLAGCAAGSYFTGWSGEPFRILTRRALQRRDVDAAEGNLRWAGRLGRPTGETEFLWARVRRKQARLEDVSRHLQRAVELGYSRESARREALLARAQTGDIGTIMPELSRLLQDPGDDGVEILEAYANGCLAVQRFDLAEMALDTWESSYPDDPFPNYLRGREFEHLERTADAERQYRAALGKRADLPGPAYRLGRLLLDNQRVDEAEREFERGLRWRHPAPFRVGVAECRIRSGRGAAARDNLIRATSLTAEQLAAEYRAIGEPYEFDVAALELGRLELSDEHFEEALRWLERALERNPHDQDAHYSHAVALRSLGRVQEASREFRQVVEARQALQEVSQLTERLASHPDDVEARYKIGMLFLKYGSELTGVFWLNSALTYKPDDAATHRALAEHYDLASEKQPHLKPLADHHRKLAEDR